MLSIFLLRVPPIFTRTVESVLSRSLFWGGVITADNNYLQRIHDGRDEGVVKQNGDRNRRRHFDLDFN